VKEDVDDVQIRYVLVPLESFSDFGSEIVDVHIERVEINDHGSLQDHSDERRRVEDEGEERREEEGVSFELMSSFKRSKNIDFEARESYPQLCRNPGL